MSVPTHRESCETRIWKTTCLDCKKPVYFFACSCGSKVFFDLLGDPWPLHADSCPVYHARVMIQSGADPRAIRRLLDSQVKASGIPIPPELDQYLSGYGASGKIYYNDELPSEDPCEIKGRIHEVNKINFFKRFELDDNLIMRRLLGELVTEPYLEVIVREDADQDIRIRKRWTFVVPEEEAAKLRKGMTVYATLQGKPIIDDVAIWVASDLDWK